MTPDVIMQILLQCNDAVPQWLMVWNAREHRFEIYPTKETQ